MEMRCWIELSSLIGYWFLQCTLTDRIFKIVPVSDDTLDLGITKWVEMGPCMSYEGTRGFMAPELFDPTVEPYGTPADMWSCGVVLHFMSVTPQD